MNEIAWNLRQAARHVLIAGTLARRKIVPMRLPSYDGYWSTLLEGGDLTRPRPYVKNHVPVSMSPLAYKRDCSARVVGDAIERLGVKNVLEVGAGAGLNFLFLAPRFPAVHFTGIEPSPAGVALAQKLLAEPPELFPEARAATPIQNVRCLQGDILAPVPLPGSPFDFVYTAGVLEQLHGHEDAALRNIFALGSGYFFFFEEWREANERLGHYRYLVGQDYFRMSWHDLGPFPVEVLERSIPTLQPSWLQYGVMLCRKRRMD